MCCNCKTVCRIALSLICLFSFRGVEAQDAAPVPVSMEIRSASVGNRIVSHVLKIANLSQQPFNGTVLLDPHSEVRSLSNDERRISIAPGDSAFVAYKLLVGDSEAGRKTVRYAVLNDRKEEVLHRETHMDIERRERIYLQSDDTPVMVINPEDSIRIRVTVDNSGNTVEDVTVVFNVANLRGVPPFTEFKARVAPMERKQFTYSFLPSKNLLSSSQFSVQITAMKGREKTIFGNKSVTVQNVFSNRHYIDTDPARTLYPGQGSADNSLTLSYRQYNSTSGMLQLQGGGYMNLPDGYLHLKGNIYQYNSQQTPMVTNTSLMYKLYENEFTVGNVSEQTELPLYGRGAKVLFSDVEKRNTLTFGAVDQNFNLVGSEPWFSDYYSFYVQGTLGANNFERGLKATYIYQKNPYEKASYNVGGLQWRTLLGKHWSIHLESYGSMGNYEAIRGSKFSGSAEVRYRGDLPAGVSLNGSGYWSDGHFPGSRKGTLSLSQGISKKFRNDLYLSASGGFNKTEPKSYAYKYTYRSENSYANLSFSLPKLGKVTPSMYYRYQGESSPSYSSWLESETAAGNLRMASHRLGAQGRWQSPDAKHSLFTTVEGGFFDDPLQGGRTPQSKATLNYSWEGFSADVSHQKGAFYLYEYMTSKSLGKEFYRFTASASYRKTIAKKLSLSSGMQFSRDRYQGNVPSANLTADYFAGNNLAFFLNAYWYRYNFGNSSNIFNVQVGVTWNFSKAQPLSGRKSTVAQVYYDHNGNSRFDKGDEPASGYLLDMDEKAFIAGKDGKVRYSLVPYGQYTFKPLRAGRWFFSPKKITVDGSRKKIDIPLTQSGSLRGNIRYVEGENSLDIVPRYEGIRFVIADPTGKNIVQTVVTDAQGRFHTFLPVGEYTITLDKKTLLDNTDCEDSTRTLTVEAGKTSEPAPFVVAIKSRKVNVKKFFSAP